MQLRNRAHYHFHPAAPSLYRGLCFIADRTSTGYALYTPEEWDRAWSDPHFVVDACGRVLQRGAWTGDTAEVLVRVPEPRSDVVAEHGSLGLLSRPQRCDHGAPCVPGTARRLTSSGPAPTMRARRAGATTDGGDPAAIGLGAVVAIGDGAASRRTSGASGASTGLAIR